MHKEISLSLLNKKAGGEIWAVCLIKGPSHTRKALRKDMESLMDVKDGIGGCGRRGALKPRQREKIRA